MQSNFNLCPSLRACLDILREGPVLREDLDDKLGVSNSPGLVRRLRAAGYDIECQMEPRPFGKKKPNGDKLAGRYALRVIDDY